MKKAIFYGVTFAPLALIVAGAAYITLFTNLLPMLNLQSIRNIYFECMVFVPEPYVYKMRPGECKFNNIEYRTVMHHDPDGFVIRRTSGHTTLSRSMTPTPRVGESATTKHSLSCCEHGSA